MLPTGDCTSTGKSDKTGRKRKGKEKEGGEEDDEQFLKKQCKAVKRLSELSGSGWDSKNNMVVATNDVWAPILQVYKDAKTQHNKPFPYCDDLFAMHNGIGDGTIGDAISRVRFAPKSNNLLVSSWDSVLRLYDVDASLLRLEARTDGALLDCCFEGDNIALTAGSDGYVRRFDLSSGDQDVTGTCDDVVTSIEYSSETGQVITCTIDNKLIFWDVRRNECPSSMIDFETNVRSLSLYDTDLLVATRNSVFKYDLRNLTSQVGEAKSSMEYTIRSVRSFPKFQGYATGSVDGCVALKYFDQTKERNMGCLFRCHPKLSNGRSRLVPINDIAAHPFYETFVTGDDEGYAIVWDAQARKKLFQFPRCSNSVASLSYNQNGNMLAIASSYTYHSDSELEEAPRIYIQNMEKLAQPCSSKTENDAPL